MGGLTANGNCAWFTDFVVDADNFLITVSFDSMTVADGDVIDVSKYN